MRVVFTTYGFPLYRHSFIEDHVLALAQLGVDVHVVASAVGDHEVRPHCDSSVNVLSAPWSAPRTRKVFTLARSVGRAVINNRRELRSLGRALRRRVGWRRVPNRLYVMAPALSADADVVHIGWLAAATEWIDLIEAIDRPVIVSCHGADLLVDPLSDPALAQRVREVFGLVDLVHCVSEELADHAVRMGAEPSKVVIGSWGTDTAFFRPPDSARPSSSLLHIVSVGRVHWVKDYECALAALHQVQEAGIDFQYSILGEADPRARQSVLTAVRDFGLEDRVQLRGLGTRDQVLDALRSSDVFLLTSVCEGVCTAALEAMSVGLPVVVTDVGGMRSAVGDGVGGVVVAPRDPTAVSAAIQRLARDPALRSELGRNARQRVVSQLDIAARSGELLEQYQRLADQRP